MSEPSRPTFTETVIKALTARVLIGDSAQWALSQSDDGRANFYSANIWDMDIRVIKSREGYFGVQLRDQETDNLLGSLWDTTAETLYKALHEGHDNRCASTRRRILGTIEREGGSPELGG